MQRSAYQQWMKGFVAIGFCLVGFCLDSAVSFSEPLNDPTKPAGYQGASPEKPGVAEVKAIVIRGDYRAAQIAGQFIQEGQTVEGIHVTHIEHNEVTFTRGGRVFQVSLVPEVLQQNMIKKVNGES